MGITKLINTEMIILNLAGNHRDEVLEELTNCLVSQGVVTSKVDYLDDVKRRESLGSTSVGMGIAIPHGKSRSVARPAVAVGRKPEGFTWDEDEQEKTRLVFLIAVPDKGSSHEHLSILAALSRRLLDDNLRQALLTAKTKEEILALLEGGRDSSEETTA